MNKTGGLMKIFVSGTYDILHAGHIQFFKDAIEYGRSVAPKDFKISLIVSFCSEKNLLKYKGRKSSMPDDNKKILLESIRYVDKVYKGDEQGVWDFVPAFIAEQPDVLAITEDDKFRKEKMLLCEDYGVKLCVLPKTQPDATQVSTSEIISNIRGN